jgi:hypothetical protein
MNWKISVDKAFNSVLPIFLPVIFHLPGSALCQLPVVKAGYDAQTHIYAGGYPC